MKLLWSIPNCQERDILTEARANTRRDTGNMVVAQAKFETPSLSQRQCRTHEPVFRLVIGMGVIRVVETAQQLGTQCPGHFSIELEFAATGAVIERGLAVIGVFCRACAECQRGAIALIVPADRGVSAGVVIGCQSRRGDTDGAHGAALKRTETGARIGQLLACLQRELRRRGELTRQLQRYEGTRP